MKSVVKFLDLRKENEIKFQLHAKRAFEPCHFVVYDETRKEIIVSIRGTMVCVHFFFWLSVMAAFPAPHFLT